ncbi:MAG: hypothetical protein ABJM29_08365 [Rhizobiaceae bacterium]
MIRKFARSAALIGVLLMLSGCFVSTVPFISAAEADFPFQSITYEFEGEDDRVTLVRVGDAYTAPDEQGDSTLLMKALKNDLYVVQASTRDGESRVLLYSVIKLAADKKSAELIRPFAESEDLMAAAQGRFGLQTCPQDDRMVCLTSLQAYIDYALSSPVQEQKRIRIIDLK